MSRGFPSQKALDAAIPVALARGEVKFFRQDRGTAFLFLIIGPLYSALVSVKRARCIQGTPAAIEAENAATLAQIRITRPAPGTTLEFWLWSPYGTLRFFRVEPAGLVELDWSGTVLAVQAAGKNKKPSGLGGAKTKTAVPAKKEQIPKQPESPEPMGDTIPGGGCETPAPVKRSGAGAEPAPVTGVPGPLLPGPAGSADKGHEPEPAATGRG